MTLPALVFLLLLSAAALGLAYPAVSRLGRAGGLTLPEQFATSLILGLLVLYFAVWGIGSWRLDAAAMAALVAVALAAAIPGLRAFHRAAAAQAAGIWAVLRGDRLLSLLVLCTLGVAAASLLQGLAPPNDYDSLMYHLAGPRESLERGVIAPAWNMALPHVFFPAYMHHLYRLALALSGGPAAQLVHGLMATIAALATYSLARRFGSDRRVAVVAALFLLAVRAVVWETATAEVDAALMATTVVALVLLLAWLRQPNVGMAVLLGLVVGAGVLVKAHGWVVAIGLAVSLVPCVIARRRWTDLLAVGLAGLAVIAPHLIHMTVLSGNPLFPLFNGFFGGAKFFYGAEAQYGTGRGLVDLLIGPWALSVSPMRHFDGMVLGAPYLLALAPFGLAGMSGRWRAVAVPTLALLALYYVAWFFKLSQQVRFLMPVYPILAVLAARGGQEILARAVSPVPRLAAFGLLGVLALNQLMFVGIYAALRLPVALGIQSPEAYHRTPTLSGAYYPVCTWIEKNLAPGERYLSLLVPHSYYCPQHAAIRAYFPDEERAWLSPEPPQMTAAQFIRRFKAAELRYVVVQTAWENRRNDSGVADIAATDGSETRLGRFIIPAIRGLRPLTTEPLAAVYDASEVLMRLEQLEGAK